MCHLPSSPVLLSSEAAGASPAHRRGCQGPPRPSAPQRGRVRPGRELGHAAPEQKLSVSQGAGVRVLPRSQAAPAGVSLAVFAAGRGARKRE